jgi:hypothetical protein
MEESLAGRLLIASPSLHDPNFTRTVVLISLHSADGAMGVVLNRPSRATVGEAVPALEEALPEDEPVYVGGPVQPTSIVCLAEFLDPAAAGLLVLGRIGFPAPAAGASSPATPAGARGSSTPRSSRGTGSRTRRSPTTSSPKLRTSCGGVSSSERAATTPCSRACPPIRASTRQPIGGIQRIWGIA